MFYLELLLLSKIVISPEGDQFEEPITIKGQKIVKIIKKINLDNDVEIIALNTDG